MEGVAICMVYHPGNCPRLGPHRDQAARHHRAPNYHHTASAARRDEARRQVRGAQSGTPSADERTGSTPVLQLNMLTVHPGGVIIRNTCAGLNWITSDRGLIALIDPVYFQVELGAQKDLRNPMES